MNTTSDCFGVFLAGSCVCLFKYYANDENVFIEKLSNWHSKKISASIGGGKSKDESIPENQSSSKFDLVSCRLGWVLLSIALSLVLETTLSNFFHNRILLVLPRTQSENLISLLLSRCLFCQRDEATNDDHCVRYCCDCIID
jgi:hypothetical protein